MTNYRLSLIQTHIEWESPEKNYRRYEKLIDENIPETDAVLLPEMFATGFSMNTGGFAETMDGPSISWMREMAASRNMAIGGSLIIRENEGVKNRFVWMLPNGNYTFYDKRHLFRMGLENEFYKPGHQRIVVEHKGFRFLLAVCYDLRFPVWLRNRNDYDAILLVANWPAARRDVWTKLIYARALENLCYMAAVNRTGTDGNEIDYTGDSMAVDMKGQIMHLAAENREEVFTVVFDLNKLLDFRQKFPAWADADDFEIRL